MARHVLPREQIHPAIRDRVDGYHKRLVDEVQAAIEADKVVVVGMKQNPHPKKARAALTAAGIEHTYLEYGSYTSMWRERSALKMWTGWPTFPMVFVEGTFVGGASDLIALLEAGEFKELRG